MAYADYKGKSHSQYDSLDFYAHKYMTHDRFTKHRPSIYGVDMIAMLWHTHFCFQPESRQEAVRRESQGQQKALGAQMKSVGTTHRAFLGTVSK